MKVKIDEDITDTNHTSSNNNFLSNSILFLQALQIMPALTMFGRRWLSGSDDFFITGLFFCIWNIIVTCLIFIPYFHGACPQKLALPLGCITACGIAIFFFLTVFTLKGRILEPSSRNKPVVTLLYLAVLQNVGLTVVGIWATVEFFKDDFPASCTHREAVSLKVAAIKTLILPFLFFAISIIIRWDPHGGLSENQLRQDPHLYHDTWVSRMKKMFCCYASEDNSEYFDHIASVMSFLFQGHDLVPTDILAGLTLLGSHQRRVMRKRAKDLVKYDLNNIELDDGKVQGSDVKVSHQAVPLHALTDEDKNIVDKVAHFSKYFMAAYGWALFVFRDLKCGFCKLCTADCTTCCRTRSYTSVGDNCCNYNNVALQATAKLNDDDIILASFENEMMLPTFYVAIDRQTDSIVIAVRGTMSLEDTMVDLVATPAKMVIRDLQNNNNNNSIPSFDSCMVHSGILKSANNVFDRLGKHGVFKSLVEEGGAHSSKKVTIIGHSLGAGVATLLTLLIRERFPDQLREPRLSCFAVSPPGGLLSRDLAEYTTKFIVSPFVGMDIIPRLSMQNMINMRDAMFECLSAAQHNKNVVFLHSACPCSCCNGTLLPHPEEVSDLPPEIAKRVTTLLNRSEHTSGENVAKARDAKIQARVDGSNLVSSSSISSSSSQKHTATSAVTIPDDLSANLASNNNTRKINIEHGLSTEDSSKSFEINLYPPGRLLQYANVASVSANCECSYCCGMSGTDALCSKKIHLPTWVTMDDLAEIVVCPAMGLDHLPDRCQNIFENTNELVIAGSNTTVRCVSQKIDGFFTKGLTAEAAETERRQWEPTWFQSSPLRNTVSFVAGQQQKSSDKYDETSSISLAAKQQQSSSSVTIEKGGAGSSARSYGSTEVEEVGVKNNGTNSSSNSSNNNNKPSSNHDHEE